jgi:hypothetical protein
VVERHARTPQVPELTHEQLRLGHVTIRHRLDVYERLEQRDSRGILSPRLLYEHQRRVRPCMLGGRACAYAVRDR